MGVDPGSASRVLWPALLTGPLRGGGGSKLLLSQQLAQGKNVDHRRAPPGTIDRKIGGKGPIRPSSPGRTLAGEGRKSSKSYANAVVFSGAALAGGRPGRRRTGSTRNGDQLSLSEKCLPPRVVLPGGPPSALDPPPQSRGAPLRGANHVLNRMEAGRLHHR